MIVVDKPSWRQLPRGTGMHPEFLYASLQVKLAENQTLDHRSGLCLQANSISSGGPLAEPGDLAQLLRKLTSQA